MEAIENAAHHDVNALIVEFEPSEEQPGRVWSTFIDDLAFNDHTPGSPNGIRIGLLWKSFAPTSRQSPARVAPPA